MTKLLSDLDLSRSFAVASFLELEAAARSCMSSNQLLLRISIGSHCDIWLWTIKFSES